MNAPETLRVVAAVIFDGKQILACQRSEGRAAQGKWEFPGGKVEAGEHPEEALRREIREELNAELQVGRRLNVSSTDVAGTLIELSCYRCTFVSEVPTSSTDHDELRWLKTTELAEIDWARPDLPMVRLLTEDFLVQ